MIPKNTTTHCYSGARRSAAFAILLLSGAAHQLGSVDAAHDDAERGATPQDYKDRRLLGRWRVKDFRMVFSPNFVGGGGVDKEIVTERVWEFTEDHINLRKGRTATEFDYTTDSAAKPRRIKITPFFFSLEEGSVSMGVYEYDGDTLRICFAPPHVEPPARVDGRPKKEFAFLVTLEREKKD